MNRPLVIAVFAGMPREVDLPGGGTLRTGMVKTRREGQVVVGARAIEGDGCELTEFHGLEDQALCVYPASHWPTLSERTGVELVAGAVGENLAVEGLDEASVRVGSVWRWGEVRMEVTKPRQPCSNICKVNNAPELSKVIAQEAWTGWYCRVLTPGTAQAGQALELERDAPEGPTIAEAWRQRTGRN